MTAFDSAAPIAVGRDLYERALAEQVAVEKDLTHLGDGVSASRRRLPMTPNEDSVFTGDDGPGQLTDLFGEHPQLALQAFMFHRDWDDGCPSCTWAANHMPRDLDGRGTEAILPVPATWDRTVFGRQHDFEDSPQVRPIRFVVHTWGQVKIVQPTTSAHRPISTIST